MKWLIIIVFSLPLVARAEPVDSLIWSLNDADSQKRIQAENELARLGLSARPALVEASRSSNPSIAAAASRLLLAQPWFSDKDPYPVQILLNGYGTSNEAERIKVISNLAQLPGEVSHPALLRLIMEDPSEDVCWKIVTVLCPPINKVVPDPGIQHLALREMARRLNPSDARPAALVLAGRAWIWKDRAKALDYLARALRAESRRASYDDNELDFAFDRLAQAAVAEHRYDDAAQLRRDQSARIGVTQNSNFRAVYELFFLHGNYGPLKGFEGDVQRFSDQVDEPQVLYAISRAYARSGRMLESLMIDQTALNASLEPLSRKLVIQSMEGIGWRDLIPREGNALLGVEDDLSYRLEGHEFLANLASRTETDALAIDHFGAIRSVYQQITNASNDPVAIQEAIQRLDREIAMHTARIAEKAGDAATLSACLDKIVADREASTDANVVENVYPMLVAHNGKPDAERLFNDAYLNSRQRLAIDPDNPEYLNNIAWLCARCDQKLPEALDFAKRAVLAEPYEASFIDTLAEVNFRVGNAAESVKLEIRALDLEPNDAFMTRQLARFRGK
ncbi:MAG TPA: hypothetical protein VHD56_10155 [Tepidisphaeraceae bacterium]|nr:hypothetical protein [Tepidisphaeraceae bacterium]